MSDRTDIPIPAVAANCGPFKVIDGNYSYGNSEQFYCIFPSNNSIGKLSVPLGESQDQIAIRLHEYGHLMLVSMGFHAANLPEIARREKIDDYWFQIALDVIVNSFLAKRNCEEISNLPLSVLYFPDLTLLAQIFLRSVGLKSEKRIKQKIAKRLSLDDIAILEMAGKELNLWSQQEKLPIKDFFTLIKRLEKRFGSTYAFAESWGETMILDGSADDHDDHDDNNKTRIDTAPLEILKDFLDPKHSKKDQRLIAEKMKININDNQLYWNRWGDMELVHLPLTKVHPTRKNARKFRPGFVGAFRYPHRALIPASDGSAFAYRQKAKGGTALLDCSGSMQLSLRDINHLLDYAPMLTVAGYGGINNMSGSLAIFIKNGMLADKSSIQEWHSQLDGGNIIDGPALRWLMKHPKPHIWISDGKVTGISDGFSDNLNLEVKILQRMGSIKQHLNIHDCLKTFKGV